jgi:hypothetical protein
MKAAFASRAAQQPFFVMQADGSGRHEAWVFKLACPCHSNPERVPLFLRSAWMARKNPAQLLFNRHQHGHAPTSAPAIIKYGLTLKQAFSAYSACLICYLNGSKLTMAKCQIEAINQQNY